MALVDPTRVLRYMKLEDSTEEEKQDAAMIQAAVEAYLLGGGCIKSQVTDDRFIFVVCAMTLHLYDHRELLSELNTNPAVLPLGAPSMITQLKADALKVSNSDAGGENA